MSYQKIADELNSRGVRPISVDKWEAMTVYDITSRKNWQQIRAGNFLALFLLTYNNSWDSIRTDIIKNLHYQPKVVVVRLPAI